MEKVVVSVPGKIILVGEHAVVYGYPALVATVDKRLRVKIGWRQDKRVIIKDRWPDLGLAKWVAGECLKYVECKGVEIEIDSEISVGSGMGSSAALATGIVWGMLKNKPVSLKNKIVEKSENKQHVKASGVDQLIVREGGVLRFQKGEKFEVTNLEFLEYLLIDSGRPAESTGEMVMAVSERYKRDGDKYKKIFRRMGEMVDSWKPKLITENQRLLEKIGVVGEKAKKIIREIEKIGGMAKVCGAGGVKRGSGIILAYHPNSEGLLRFVETNKWRYFKTQLGVEGVRYEKN